MEISMWPVEKLVLYARTPRKNKPAVDRMAALLRGAPFDGDGRTLDQIAEARHKEELDAAA